MSSEAENPTYDVTFEDEADPQVSAPAVTRVGRYELAFELATGGMATVYVARALGPAGFERLVALKRIHPHLAKQRSFVEMFLDEARIASRIHHANVCSVFDFGEADDSYYIAMEYLIGEPFSRVVKTIHSSPQFRQDPRLPLLVARVIADACEGLHAAHELRGANGDLLNVVHRDISPQNLFLTYDGSCKVVDFGIASASDRLHTTDTGQVKGKFSYMSPEQVQGRKVDRRSDVWALGVVLWESLTQRRLFRRRTAAETLVAMLNEPAPAPSAYRPAIPPELDSIVAKALDRDVERRYQSARELGRDLTRFIGHSGDGIGMADLADWMDALFPQGRSKLAQQLEAAKQGQPSATTARPPPLERSDSGVSVPHYLDENGNVTTLGAKTRAPVSDETPILGPNSASTSLPTPGPIDVPTAAKPAQPKRSPLMAGAIVAILGLLGGSGIVYGWQHFSSGDSTHTVVVPRGDAPTAHGAQPFGNGPAANTAQAETSIPHETNPPVVAEAIPVATAPVSRTPSTVAAARPEQPARPHHGNGPRRQTGGRDPEPTPTATATRTTPPPQQNDDPPGGEAQTGRVRIATPGGWARIYAATSGRYLGEAPTTIDLPAGTHVLRVRPLGQPPDVRVTVEVRGGQTRTLEIPIAPH